MKMQLMLLMILSTLFLLNCEKTTTTIDNEASINNFKVNYGTGFGMCVGPCRKELNLVNDEITFTVYITEGRGGVGGTPKSFNEKLDASFSQNLLKNIDYNTFKKLDEIIGCPDCADGGSEWLEIYQGDSKHKVVFEFGKSPKEIEKLVTILREKRVLFEDKYLK
jgi:hypothetical protein